MKRARSRKRGQSPSPVRHPSGPSALPSTVLSPGRKWLLRLLAVFVPPLLLLGALELFLRLIGFGFDPHFFKTAKIGGQDCYVANDDFGLRFFPHNLARIPAPVVVPAKKAPGACRIFIFGESAALGDPRPNYGAGCYLEALLAERFPQTKFEVINTGITAINSHAILPIAQECATHQGDLWLIYMGNNEMVGPFGAATVFGARAPPLWLIRAQLLLQRLRLGQWLLALSQKLHKSNPTSESWHGMEMFAQSQVSPADPRRQRVYRNFQRNLEEILKTGLASGAKVILSTVAVNLKDCPPFGTSSGDELTAASRASFEKLCRAGDAAETQGNFADARSDFQQATEICPEAAEAQYRLATCQLRLTNATMAGLHFLQAVDTDTLPFRADSHINGIIREAGRQLAGESLVLCDAAKALSASSSNGVSGDEFFYEHVHLNPEGNYALALAWAAHVEKLFSPALRRGAQLSWLGQDECEQLLGLTEWNRVSILEEVLRRVQQPPFIGQSGHAQRLAVMRNKIAELRQKLTPEAAARARETYLRALRRAPENFRLHENYAEFLEAMHEWNPATTERKKVCELIPDYYFPYYALGVDLKEAGALAEARDALQKAQTLRPEQPQVRLELGIICARQGAWDLARQYLEEARRLAPEDPQAGLYLGEVLWRLDRRREAVDCLRAVMRLAPAEWQPHYRLASDLAQQGSLSEAASEYQEALRLNPANVKIKLGLGAVLLGLGRQTEALQQLDEALKLEPNNPAALEFQRKLRGLR